MGDLRTNVELTALALIQFKTIHYIRQSLLT